MDLKHLRRETQILQNLSHPNIIKLYEVHENEQEIYFVMELVSEGLDLFDRICERGQYSEKDALAIITQIVEGVEYLHSHGMIFPSICPHTHIIRRNRAQRLETRKPVDCEERKG